jgi:hypothetical protein
MAYDPAHAGYHDHEWSLDTAGVVSSSDRENFTTRNSIGIGVGVNYFIMRYFGVGADTYIDHFDWPNHLDFSAIGRYPITDTGIAPYVIGGFGRQFHDVPMWTGDIGLGVEYRWNAATGVFFDVRECFSSSSSVSDFSVWRLGLRIRF